jgi:hypothetical protein
LFINILYNWKRLLERTGTVNIAPKDAKKENWPEKLPEAVKKRPYGYLKAYAEPFGRSVQSVFSALKKPDITLKKGLSAEKNLKENLVVGGRTFT